MISIAKIIIKEKNPGFDLIFSFELKTLQDVIPKFEISFLSPESLKFSYILLFLILIHKSYINIYYSLLIEI